MNELKQPDTSTMEGRHAVELASRKFRIQRSHSFKSSKWVNILVGDHWVFRWDLHRFRIHPDDLQAWHDSQKRDVWSAKGTIKRNAYGPVQLYRNGEGFYFFKKITQEAIEELLAALNGDRCGVRIRKGGA